MTNEWREQDASAPSDRSVSNLAFGPRLRRSVHLLLFVIVIAFASHHDSAL